MIDTSTWDILEQLVREQVQWAPQKTKQRSGKVIPFRQQFNSVVDSITEEQRLRMVDEWKKSAAPAICPSCGGGTKRPIHRWHYRGCAKKAEAVAPGVPFALEG